MLASLVIFFRESLEASFIVGIILAYMHQAGHVRYNKWVWTGVGIAVGADLAIGLIAYHLVHSYDGSRLQTVLEGTTYLVATGMLTYMSFWMKRESKNLKGNLERQVETAFRRGSLLSLVGLALISVGREGLETVFFTLAIAFSTRAWALWTGALGGVLLGVGVTYAVYRLGKRVPLGLFFTVLGVLLLLFASGLLADGIQDYQALGWIPFLTGAVWHSGQWLQTSSPLGDILHSFFGYAANPSVLQVSGYLLFLVLSVSFYTDWISRARRPKRRVRTS